MTNKFIKKYMRFAALVGSDQNPCLSRGIGSVIVDPVRNAIVSTGYNGPAKGVPHLDSKESLEEFVYPQLTEEDKKYINSHFYTIKSQSLPGSNCESFAKHFTGCKTCPRKLVGAKSGERLDLCACLSYESRIQLSDGKWEKIGKLVKERYNGEVLSLNLFTNKIESKRIIDWFEIDNKYSNFIKIITKNNRLGKHGNLGSKFTPDHELLTKEGYKRIDEIKVGDSLVVSDRCFTNNQLQLILGSCLGDGSMVSSSRTARFKVHHSYKQENYIKFKSNILKNISRPIAVEYGDKVTPTGKLYPNYKFFRLSSTCTVECIYLKNMMYINGIKKISREWLEKIDWLGLSFWYLDDGSRGTNKKSGYICIHYFIEEVQLIQEILLNKFHLETIFYPKRKMLAFNKKSFYNLSKGISKFVPPSMKYKIHPDFQDVEIELPEDQNRIIYDEVVNKENACKDLSDIRTKVYCIEVKDNHNFLTMNSIAKNCVHSERNALLNAERGLIGCYLFAYCGIPCLDCTIEIINSGIKKVFCLEKPEQEIPGNNSYGFWRSRWLFKKADIEVIELEEDWILKK